MALMLSLYTDFPSFQKAEDWLDLQINLLSPHSNLVRWPSTDAEKAYTEGGVHTIHGRSPPDTTIETSCKILDARYEIFANARKAGSKKVFVTKNGWLSYTSKVKPDFLCDASILFRSGPVDGTERGSNPFAMVDTSDKNPYQVDSAARMFWDPAMVIDVATLGGDIANAQDTLRTMLFSLLVKHQCDEVIPALTLSPLLEPPGLKSVVVVCGLAVSGKSSVFSYLKSVLSPPKAHSYCNHSA